MPFEYLDDIATADVAFHAWGESLEETFKAAAEATMNVMVGDLSTIDEVDHRSIRVEADAVDMLLFELLQELIYYKDAEKLLLRIDGLKIEQSNGLYTLTADARGEELDPGKHDLVVDVKAVTLHRFAVEETPGGWRATVILDI
ncbi:MAG: archease [Syntrophobacteraceae bacterium]|jgi:SHS2 domain-containing protein|nr:archease [Syntrophobacteraceae bacterium]